jgi:hypothetical protein
MDTLLNKMSLGWFGFFLIASNREIKNGTLILTLTLTYLYQNYISFKLKPLNKFLNYIHGFF